MRENQIHKGDHEVPSSLACDADKESYTQRLDAVRGSKLKEQTGNVYENKGAAGKVVVGGHDQPGFKFMRQMIEEGIEPGGTGTIPTAGRV